jgi:pyrrolysine biosynthesis protein PylC
MKIRLLIAGGRLQGIEIAYLAGVANMETVLVDIDEQAPAAGLVSTFVVADIFDAERLLPLVASCDAVLPAIEDIEALEQLMDYGSQTGVPVICDLQAYRLSSSKVHSTELFERLGLPVPQPWPQCGLPVIVKPDSSSGSQGVQLCTTAAELEAALEAQERSHPGVTLGSEPEMQRQIQTYIEGRSYSVEVLGNGSDYWIGPITEVVCGTDFDCIRIIAPAEISEDLAQQFQSIAEALARELRINGIFDIEVIDDNGLLRLLEIDARMPSQTPVSIYHATGINMVELLALSNTGAGFAPSRIQEQNLHPCLKPCIYQQIQVIDDQTDVVGEHVIAGCGPLHIEHDFHGADIAITDYAPGKREWAAILIFKDGDACHDKA